MGVGLMAPVAFSMAGYYFYLSGAEGRPVPNEIEPGCWVLPQEASSIDDSVIHIRENN